MRIEQSAILRHSGIPMGMLEEKCLKLLRLWHFRSAREVIRTFP